MGIMTDWNNRKKRKPKPGLITEMRKNRKPKQQKKRGHIGKNIRNLVWQIYNKNSLTGNCYVCDRPITNDNFDLGHNKAVSKGRNDAVSNLRPICRPCNSDMGTMTIEKYKAIHFGKKSNK